MIMTMPCRCHHDMSFSMNRILAFAAAALGVVATPATADPFILFIHEFPADLALRAVKAGAGADYWARWAE